MRAFVAVTLSTRLVAEAVAIQKRLRQAAEEREAQVRWVPPGNIHMTLKFLGEIPDETGPAIIDFLSSQLSDIEAFPVSSVAAGAFPSCEEPRVLWMSVEDRHGELTDLAERTDKALTELGFAPETRAFAPHITLGRVKDGKTAGLLDEAKGMELKATATIRDVVLFRSVLGTQGAQYTPIGRVALTGKRKET